MVALAESTGDPCTLVPRITLFTRAVTACGEGIPPLTGVAGTTTGEEGFPPGLWLLACSVCPRAEISCSFVKGDSEARGVVSWGVNGVEVCIVSGVDIGVEEDTAVVLVATSSAAQ